MHGVKENTVCYTGAMEEQFTAIVAIVLMLCTGYLTLESLWLKRVRVRGSETQPFTFKPSEWYHWIPQAEHPGPYWFWTTFYAAGFFLGVYFLVAL